MSARADAKAARLLALAHAIQEGYFDLFTFMDAVKYRHLNAKLVNGNIKIGDKLFSPEKSNRPIVL